MSDAMQRFTEAATVLGLQPQPRRFPAGTKTADDAAKAIGCDVGQIVKSLVFMAGDRPVLALTSGSNRVDESKLASAAGADAVRRATPDEARAATGFAVGGTPPFGHVEQVRAFCDRDLAPRRGVGGGRHARFRVPSEPCRSGADERGDRGRPGGRLTWISHHEGRISGSGRVRYAGNPDVTPEER
jgi:prolyl-tRNA editing enzyme YbaK/EbsC (Cys-tRNA(Pro) deacylase)